jgi:hypothetical protein
MNEISGPLLWIVFASFALALVVLIGMAYLFSRSYPTIDESVLRIITEPYKASATNQQFFVYALDKEASLYAEFVSDVLAKREIFWTLLIQSTISLVVVVFIAILLLLRTVTAEAGLPILAAFGGAAISRGVSSVRTRSRIEPPPRPG